MTKAELVPKVIYADNFYMTTTATKSIEQVGSITWADSPDDETFLKLVEKIQPEVIIAEYVPITGPVMDATTSLKGVVGWGVGVDHIDVAAASERGIYVANTFASNAESVAEHVFALLLGLARKILRTNHYVKSGNWTTREEAELPGEFIAEDLLEKTIGILGLGAIGSRVARIAHGFNMRILGYDPYIKKAIAKELGVEKCDLDYLLQESDIVMIHVPLTPETHHLISTRELQLMKPSAYLLNASRGDVINEIALIDTLSANKLAGVGLDVFSHEPLPTNNPLLQSSNAILTPHCASNSKEALDITSQIVAEQSIMILKGQIPNNLVNRSQLIKRGILS